MASCTIVVEQLEDGRFRAGVHFLPDVEAVADTADEARSLAEQAIERYLREHLTETKTIATDEHR